jgi:hypothetical protein
MNADPKMSPTDIHPQMPALSFSQDNQNFSQDADRNFCRRIGANVEPERSVNLREEFVPDSVFFQLIEDPSHLAAAPDHSDKTDSLNGERGDQSISIDFVIAAHDHERFIRLPFAISNEFGRGRLSHAGTFSGRSFINSLRSSTTVTKSPHSTQSFAISFEQCPAPIRKIASFRFYGSTKP